jgi:hypothetical protein
MVKEKKEKTMMVPKQFNLRSGTKGGRSGEEEDDLLFSSATERSGEPLARSSFLCSHGQNQSIIASSLDPLDAERLGQPDVLRRNDGLAWQATVPGPSDASNYLDGPPSSAESNTDALVVSLDT